MVSSNDKVVQSSGVEEAEGVLAELSSNGLAVPEDEVSSLSPEKLEEMIKAIRTEIKNKDYHKNRNMDPEAKRLQSINGKRNRRADRIQILIGSGDMTVLQGQTLLNKMISDSEFIPDLSEYRFAKNSVSDLEATLKKLQDLQKKSK